MGIFGLYVCWEHPFDFCLHLWNKTTRSKDLQWNIKIDNEFGNCINPHFKLKYKN